MKTPTRHPRRPLPVPFAVRTFAALVGVSAPDANEWRRLGERLTVGDEPMDRLVAWMSQAGSPDVKAMFERALAEGIANVPEAPEPLREFFVRVEAVPDWVEPAKLRRGQRVLRRAGADGMYIARDVALLGGYQFSGFNKTLLRTGALEKGSNRRFAETLQWALDILADDGLDVLGVGYRSTLRVRLIHGFVRRHVAAMPDWRPDEWGVPVNQTDMAATLVGALVAPAVGGMAMGIVPAPGDLDAVAHLTRYVGWLIGVEDEWLPRTFRESIRVLHHTSTALANPDETTRQLSVPMAQDPLSWHYDSLRGVRRRLSWAQHLSITSAFLGPGAMRALGLPAYVPPWYPALRMPLNLARSTAAMTLPGGMSRAITRGTREQHALLTTILGDDKAVIGESAQHVSSVA
jgi:hypothetical protein